MGTQCGKDYTEPDPKYNFLEKLTLTPYKKIYKLGDTIWVEYQTNEKSLYDQISQRFINTDTSFLRGNFYYQKRYPNDNVPAYYCNLIIDKALTPQFTTLYNWYNLLTFATDCDSKKYFFKIGFIPKVKGIFSFEPGLQLVYCPNKINFIYVKSKFIFDLADCNKDIWLSIPSKSRGGQDGSEFDRKTSFIFKVE